MLPTFKIPSSVLSFRHLLIVLSLGTIVLILTLAFLPKPTVKLQATKESAPTSSSPSSPPTPSKTGQDLDPQITATSALILDPRTLTILWQKNPDEPLLPASTTKIMTALIALETYPLDQIITITKEDRSIGNTMNLVSGEQITVENLLYGTLVASGNDAALALALAYPDEGYTGFVAAMNQKAADLNMLNTHYQNVSGLESPDHVTTASDLATLTLHALSHPTISRMVATKQVLVSSIDNQYHHRLVSTNQLLGQVDGVVGVKTGWTHKAGECLVTSVTRSDQPLLIIVLNSQDRFGESTSLIEWAYSNFTWI